MVEILGRIPEMEQQYLPAAVKLEPTALQINVPSDEYPRAVLFPTLVVGSDEDGAPVIRSVQVYAAVSGKHPELLTTQSRGESRDGYEVTGWGTPDYDAITGGDVTVFPVSQVKGDTLYIDGTQVHPKGTSSQFATAVINNWKGKGLYPLMLTGAIDEEGNVLRNEFIKEKQLLIQSSNVPIAVANSDPMSDVQLTTVNQALGIDNNSSGNHSFAVVQPHTKGRVHHWSADLNVILAELQKMNARIDRLEAPTAPNTSYAPPRYASANPFAPGSEVPQHIEAPQLTPIMHWIQHTNDKQSGQVVPLLTQFSERDSDGRMFLKLLTNSTPQRIIGATTEENQMAKVNRIIQSSKSMGINLDQQWVIDNGYRGPSADQVEEFKKNNHAAPNKAARVINPINAGAVDLILARKVAKNAVNPKVFEAKEQTIVDYVVTIMAQNGGKGLDQQQMKSLQNRFKAQKAEPLPTRRSMPIPDRPRLNVPNLNDFSNLQVSDDSNPFGAVKGGTEI